MAGRRKVGNLLALAVLAVLAPGRPVHPYEMATLLRRTDIKWGSLYTVVQNLDRHGLIEVAGSDRDGRRPERTLYAITDEGRAELRDWLRELLAVPEAERPRFGAALSVLGVLAPDEVVSLLRTRLAALEERIAADRAALRRAGERVSRIFLIEQEYDLAIREAEAGWVRGLLTDGTLAGLDQWHDARHSGELPA